MFAGTTTKRMSTRRANKLLHTLQLTMKTNNPSQIVLRQHN